MEAGIPFVLVFLGAVLNMVRRGERPDAAGMQRISHLLCSCVGPGLSLHGACTTVLQKRLLCKRVYGVSAGLPVLWQSHSCQEKPDSESSPACGTNTDGRAMSRGGGEQSLSRRLCKVLAVLMTARCSAQGNKHARLDGDEHMVVVEEFCMAARAKWPEVLIQFEDFPTDKAFAILDRMRNKVLCFNGALPPLQPALHAESPHWGLAGIPDPQCTWPPTGHRNRSSLEIRL